MGPEGQETSPIRDLFLSHSSTDKPIVRKIAADVTSNKTAEGRPLTVWLDEAEIRGGRSIPGAVNQGLETSRFFALLLSASYFESSSGWTDAEWHAILHVDPDNRKGRILPVLIADCPYMPPLLRHLRIIDMREWHYQDGLRELLSVIKDEPQATPTIYRGQLILAGRRVSRATIVAERSIIDADPSAVSENHSCNLLPVERLPTYVYTAPVAASLRRSRLDGTSVLPGKEAIKQAIHTHLEQTGRQLFTPAFRLDGEQIVTFHDLENPDSVFASVIQASDVAQDRTSEWLLDPDDRKIVTSLLNMAVSRHVHRRGLKEDPQKLYRYYFPPKDGGSWSVTWKPFRTTRPREVAGKRSGPRGEFWRHAAAYLNMAFLGGRFFLKIDSTWVFTSDGETIIRGPDLGRLAIKWTGAERNLALLYHVRFWSHSLRDRPGPISIRAGDQILEISSRPAFIQMTFGIPNDLQDLDQSLDTHVEYIESMEEQAVEAELERRLAGEVEPEEEKLETEETREPETDT